MFCSMEKKACKQKSENCLRELEEKILKIDQGSTRRTDGGSTCVDKKASSSSSTCENSYGRSATELKVLFRTNRGFVTITAGGASLLD